MKNAIIAALGAYIFYGFCVDRSIAISFIVFLLFWVLIEDIDENIKDFRRKVRRGKRLKDQIERAKGVRYE